MGIALFPGIVATVSAQDGKGVELGEAVIIKAEVLAIDKEDRILKVLGPKKNVVDLEVDKSVKVFDTLKVGDAIHARLTKAIAISVEKP